MKPKATAQTRLLCMANLLEWVAGQLKELASEGYGSDAGLVRALGRIVRVTATELRRIATT